VCLVEHLPHGVSQREEMFNIVARIMTEKQEGRRIKIKNEKRFCR